jgi:hypothetical protein
MVAITLIALYIWKYKINVVTSIAYLFMKYSSKQNGGRRLDYNNNIDLKLKIELYGNLYGKEFIEKLQKYYDSN